MRKTFILLALLPACAPRVYVDPTGDLRDHARITLRNASRKILYARLYDDAVTCSGPVVLTAGNKGIAPGETRSVYVKKGEPFTVGAWYWHGTGTGYRQCDLNTTFVPATASYQVTFDSDATAERCGVLPAEGEAGATRVLPKDRFAVRNANVPFGQSGPWCKGLSEAEAKALGVATPAAGSRPPQATTE